jgi:NADP-dependent 3-hydroxy acid dehydrogenase YdfG
MTKGIKGKTVVITGARSGLGEATARHLSAEGASVVMGARRVARQPAHRRNSSSAFSNAGKASTCGT